MGRVLVMVLSLETMPLGILVSATRDRSLHRRPRFWMRFAGLVICVTLPELILIGLWAVRLGWGEQAAGGLLWGGFIWGLGLAVLTPLLFFPGSTPGPSDDGGGGPDPRDDRPSPPRPIGGVPLPDAEQPSMRTRGPHPRRRATNRPRPAHEPNRGPSRVRLLLPSPQTRHRLIWGESLRFRDVLRA